MKLAESEKYECELSYMWVSDGAAGGETLFFFLFNNLFGNNY